MLKAIKSLRATAALKEHTLPLLTVGSWQITAVWQMPCFLNSNLIAIIAKAALWRLNCKMAEVNVCAAKMTECVVVAMFSF